MKTEYKSYPEQLYYTSLRTEKPVFADEADKYHFLAMLGRISQVYGVHADGFCLLDNTVHLLMDTGSTGLTAGAILRECFEENYVDYYQRTHGDSRKIKCESECELIWGKAEAIGCLGWLHILPVSRGITRRADDYWWTSWQTYRNHYIWDFVDSGRPLSLLSEDRDMAMRQLRKKQQRLLMHEKNAPVKK